MSLADIFNKKGKKLMWFILFFFVCLFIILFILNIKLINPYKLYIIIGNKGTGKTAYMTSLAHKYYKKVLRYIQILEFLKNCLLNIGN